MEVAGQKRNTRSPFNDKNKHPPGGEEAAEPHGCKVSHCFPGMGLQTPSSRSHRAGRDPIKCGLKLKEDRIRPGMRRNSALWGCEAPGQAVAAPSLEGLRARLDGPWPT